MKGSLKPYNRLKYSGLAWLGDVPEHWDVLPALAIYKPREVKNIGMQESTVLSLSYGRIVVKPEEKLRGLVPESFETYQIVDPGNIIVRTTDLQNDQTSLRIGYSHNRGIITSAYMCLETTSRVSAEFGYQYLNAYDLLKIIYGVGSGLRQNLGFTDIKRLPVLVPPFPEQASIVRFLDHMDRRIRQYVRGKHKLIKLLEEQKLAIIHRAVTRGLDPNVLLKPSGVEWLGHVPEHWEVLLNQRIFKENIRPYNEPPETPLSLSQRDGLVATTDMKERSLQTSSYENWKVTLPGDLVVNRFKAHLGVFFASSLRGIVSFHYGVLQPRRQMVTKYFEHLYHTKPYRTIYAGRSNGMTIGLQNLSNQNFYNVKTVVPPLDEQVAIVKYVDNVTIEVRTAVACLNKEIELLREYRARLIADVVTGKLDVREAALLLPEEIEELEPIDDEAVEDSSDEEAIDEIDETMEPIEA